MGHDWSKYQNLNIWSVLDESGTDVSNCHRNVVNGRKVSGVNRSLVNVGSLQPESDGAARWISHACFFVWK